MQSSDNCPDSDRNRQITGGIAMNIGRGQHDPTRNGTTIYRLSGGIYRQSTEFSANLPIRRLAGGCQSSSVRKAAGRNRQITGDIITSMRRMSMMMMTAAEEPV